MKVSFNTKEFDKRIMEVLSQFPEASKTAMQRATLVVEGEAKEQCPVDLGTLRSSITSKVNMESNGVAGYVYTNEEYAPFVHFGTGIYAKNKNGRTTPWKFKTRKGEWITIRGQKPSPFLMDALNNKKSEIRQELAKVIEYVR